MPTGGQMLHLSLGLAGESRMKHDDERLKFRNGILDAAIGILSEYRTFLVENSVDLDPEFLSIFRTENTHAVGPLISQTVLWLQAVRQRSTIDPEAITLATYMMAMCYRLAERLQRGDVVVAMKAAYGSSRIEWCVANFDRNRLSQMTVEGSG